jgi:hypothetical protein
MVLYADREPLRSRQVLTDAGVVAWVAAWVWLGSRLHDIVSRLAGPGEDVEGAGRALASAAERGSGTPVIGGAFDGVAEGGRALGRAGVAQQDAVSALAWWLAVLVVVAPTAWLLARWLPARVGWVRDATAARALLDAGGDERLFALRALAVAPLPDLRRVAADPLACYDRGEVAALAELELRRLGLTPRRLSSTCGRL